MLTTKVFIHIQEIHTPLILHIGISFESGYRAIRYDFSCNPGKQGHQTYDKRSLVQHSSPNDLKIYWGRTEHSLSSIIAYEKTLHSPYILGLYDCRHYTRKFTTWATQKPTPVWKLHLLRQ
jgi:hypothetical protein